MQHSVRSFSLSISYLSFFFRVSSSRLSCLQIIVALVFWKDSLDFNRIIKKQMDLVENKGSSFNNVASPDRTRISTYRKVAEDAI